MSARLHFGFLRDYPPLSTRPRSFVSYLCRTFASSSTTWTRALVLSRTSRQEWFAALGVMEFLFCIWRTVYTFLIRLLYLLPIVFRSSR